MGQEFGSSKLCSAVTGSTWIANPTTELRPVHLLLARARPDHVVSVSVGAELLGQNQVESSCF